MPSVRIIRIQPASCYGIAPSLDEPAGSPPISAVFRNFISLPVLDTAEGDKNLFVTGVPIEVFPSISVLRTTYVLPFCSIWPLGTKTESPVLTQGGGGRAGP